MKNYIILALSISDIGGEQQYLRNKSIEMDSLGYKVLIFSCTDGPIYISDLEKYSPLMRFYELRYPPVCFSKRRINNSLNKICHFIGETDPDSIVETVNEATAEWGELLARKLKIKNSIFLLDEAFSISKSEFSFFFFKLQRRELAGMDPKTLPALFEGYMPIPQDKAYSFNALCSNVLSDNATFKDMPIKGNGTICIGTIGRLEKQYLPVVLSDLKTYCQKKPQQDYLILIVGGTKDKKYRKRIKRILQGLPNVTVVITGYLYPLPSSLIRLMDVAISTASSALITALDLNIPTITVDTFTGKAIGILNYTTKELLYNTGEETQLADLLNDILDNNFCKTHPQMGLHGISSDCDFSLETQKYLTFIKSNNHLEYFDINSLSLSGFKNSLYSKIGHCFGPRILSFLHLKVANRMLKIKEKYKSISEPRGQQK